MMPTSMTREQNDDFVIKQAVDSFQIQTTDKQTKQGDNNNTYLLPNANYKNSFEADQNEESSS